MTAAPFNLTVKQQGPKREGLGPTPGRARRLSWLRMRWPASFPMISHHRARRRARARPGARSDAGRPGRVRAYRILPADPPARASEYRLRPGAASRHGRGPE